MYKDDNGSMINDPQGFRNGSVISGSYRGSNFQRGGSTRGSDRSIKSTRRDIDDIGNFKFVTVKTVKTVKTKRYFYSRIRHVFRTLKAF